MWSSAAKTVHNIAHGKGTSTGCDNAPVYPHGIQISPCNPNAPPGDVATSATVQEPVIVTSANSNGVSIEFEGESTYCITPWQPSQMLKMTQKVLMMQNGLMTGLNGTNQSRK